MNSKNIFDAHITLDLDWAPDFTIDFVRELLETYNVPATIFVTHLSPAVDRLRQASPLIELGIHPNFLPGSSHGKTDDEVIDYCLRLVPNAVSARSHGLVQSSSLLGKYLQKTNIRIESSPLMQKVDHQIIYPYHCEQGTIWRVPIYWEDDVETFDPKPTWKVEDHTGLGLKVLNFHPLFIYLNMSSMKPYYALKQSVQPLNSATQEAVNPYRSLNAPGSGTFFRDALDALSRTKSARTLSQLIEERIPPSTR